MTHSRQFILCIAIATSAFGAYAQTDAEHIQHHPAEDTKRAAKAPAMKTNTMAKDSMAAMDSKMNAMREMHEKMMAAKTLEERRALMADHTKLMQDAMAMVGAMGKTGAMKGMGGMASGPSSGGMSMDMMVHHELMEKRMEMMAGMMQMMMDRLPDENAK